MVLLLSCLYSIIIIISIVHTDINITWKWNGNFEFTNTYNSTFYMCVWLGWLAVAELGHWNWNGLRICGFRVLTISRIYRKNRAFLTRTRLFKWRKEGIDLLGMENWPTIRDQGIRAYWNSRYSQIFKLFFRFLQNEQQNFPKTILKLLG